LRRVSGRHQISSDGKHLFDGWIFGRPRPRGPVDRPAIEIPPRKRRRITYDDDTDSSLDESPLSIEGQAQVASDSDGNRQLILSADFEDDEEDDEDFEPNEEEEEEDDDEDILDGVPEGTRDRAVVDGLEDEPDGEDTLATLQNLGLRSEVQKLRKAFPKAPISVCKNILVGSERDLGKAWDTLSQAFEPSIPRKSLNKPPQDQETLHPANTRSKVKAPSKNNKMSLLDHTKVLDVNDEVGDPPPLDQDNSLLQYYDQHGLPGGLISTGKALSHMAKIVSSSNLEQSDESSGRNVRRRISTSTSRIHRSVRFAEGDSGTKTSDILEKDDSDDSNDEDFDLDSSIIEPEVSSKNSPCESSDDDEDESTSSEGSDASSSDSTSDSDSDSDSDLEPDEISSRPTDLQENTAPETNSPAKSLPKDHKTQQNGPVPPGQGKSSTRSRNRRRRNANLLQRYKDKGILPAGTTVKEMEQLELDKIRTPEEALQAVAEIRTEGSQKSKGLTAKAATKAAEFETRRQQLLKSLASGGVEVGLQSLSESLMAAPLDPVSKQAEMSDIVAVPAGAELETPLTPSTDKVTEVVEAGSAERDATLLATAIAITPVESPSQPPVVPTRSTTVESSSRPRRKIDLGAAGRLLFGALGVRAPKNKADHEKVRNDLIKDIKPSKTVAETPTTEIESSAVDEDPEAWREIINLRAVECCHDGVELSPAPFPFVQRWDPQQQGSYSKQGNRGGKGKRSQRNQSQYYEDDQHLSKKRKRRRNSYDTYYDLNEQFPAAEDVESEESDRYDELIGTDLINVPDTQIVYSDGVEGAVNDQIMKDVQEAATSQAMDEDDLPTLPENISMLPNFTEDDVKPGMVIAFKQLILSEATNWQPQMSAYRTAVIIKTSENGNLELRLARRDREQTEKHYDEETGERIYGKFDMPTDDDDDQSVQEDDGFLEVTINEIVEPKIVQLPPESLSATTSSPEAARNKANTSADDSTTLGHADSAETSKVSVEAPRAGDEETTGYQDLPVGDIDSPSIQEGDLLADDPEEILPLSITEDTREEISELIKEAGFRTSIPSSVLGAQIQLPTTPRSASEKGLYSPRFNGFDSSPSQPIQAISSPSHFNPTTPTTEDAHDAVGFNEDVLEDKSTISNIHYPKLSVPSSLASQVSDCGRQPDYPIPGVDTLHEFNDLDSLVGVHEELPVNRDQDPPSTRSVNVSDNSPSNHIRSSPSESFESPSSGGLPTLEEVFSTARSSIGPKHDTQPWASQKTNVKDAKKIEESYDREMEALDAMLEESEDAEQITPKASQNDRNKQSTAPAASQKESGSQFKIPPGSQQVDLTLSSDGELVAEKENVSDDSYNDNYDLPRGPGWVEKKASRTRRQTTGNSQVTSQRVPKTRTPRRKTMTKF
jgi:hypothetical protein